MFSDGRVAHIGRDTCRVINRYEAKRIRRATDEELARLTVCHWCMEDSGVSGLGSEPLVEPQGDSVRAVSGGGSRRTGAAIGAAITGWSAPRA
jgi:hypothetical protein